MPTDQPSSGQAVRARVSLERHPLVEASPANARSARIQRAPSRTPDPRQQLGAFLRTRREAISPEPRRRRRTPGLRREDIASRSHISVDYYTRLEQGRAASKPSAEVTDALADALQLTRAERAHLHRLAGRAAPEISVEEEVASSLLFILQRLDNTPGQILTDLGTVLAQNPAADAAFGWAVEEGMGTANIYQRWFCHAEVRAECPPEQRAAYSELQAGELRTAVTRRALAGDDRGYALVDELSRNSTEFQRAWAAHRVHAGQHKRIWIATRTSLDAHTTIDELTSQRLIVFHPAHAPEA